MSVIAYVAGLSFAFGGNVPGFEKAVVWCGAVLLSLSLASLAALIFPTVRARLRAAKRRRGTLISVAIITLYSVWAGSFLIFPLSE